jgi:hypothetical protein
MSEYLKKNNPKKELVKEIILNLHKGLSVEEAKKKLEKEVGTISSSEIAEIEQSLISEGMPVEEIKKFCNVHALLFESSLSKEISKEESKSHPIYLFKLENREIEKINQSIKEFISNKNVADIEVFKNGLNEILLKLKEIELHYTRKEQLLFPYLEKYGFMGPSKVMWGKDNDVRGMLKDSIASLKNINNDKDLELYISNHIDPLLEEVDGMIFKEENILFPTSKEKLHTDDWVEILKESDEVGYAFIEGPKETSSLIDELKQTAVEEPKIGDEGEILLPTGILKLKELMWFLNSLPVEITFIDKNDVVRYFSDQRDRIFVRTKSVIGRKVQNCHPPQSVDIVEKILSDFKEGKRDYADFWINFKGRLIFIKFIAIRDESSNYLGTTEFTMDITDIKKLEGEKKLLDEKD